MGLLIEEREARAAAYCASESSSPAGTAVRTVAAVRAELRAGLGDAIAALPVSGLN